MKILYQSFVNQSLSAPYLEHLKDYLNTIKAPTTEIDINELEPADKYAHPFVEFACGYQSARAIARAEQAGYNAVILGHFQDSGLEIAKAIVDVPVAGLGEISLLYGCSVARKIGLITINPRFVPVHEEQIRRYGLESRVVGISAVSFNPGELTAAFGEPKAIEAVRSSFEEQAKPLIAAGAELLIPAGGIPMLMLGMEPGFKANGVPVLNGVALVVKYTEMVVELAKLTKFHVSRVGPFQMPPPDIIDEFLAL